MGLLGFYWDPTEPGPSHPMQPPPPAVARSGNLAVQVADSSTLASLLSIYI